MDRSIRKRRRVNVVALVITLSLVLGTAGRGPHAYAHGTGNRVPTRMVLATTTSTENSGLLSALLPPFEARHNVVVDVIAVGTGQALQIGRTGDADVLMVHAPALEERFVAEGYGIERVTFMYNEFVILGPADDPAGVSQADGAAEAMRRIADRRATFISRGDNSGTHVKERELWREAGIIAEGASAPEGSWYREVGQGMGAVITLANDRQAYTLADRGTFLSYVGRIDIGVVFEGDSSLKNPYGIIAVDPRRHPHVKVDLARALIDHVTSPEGRAIIAGFLVNGHQLFFPDGFFPDGDS